MGFSLQCRFHGEGGAGLACDVDVREGDSGEGGTMEYGRGEVPGKTRWGLGREHHWMAGVKVERGAG
jgi:hypothetical protein